MSSSLPSIIALARSGALDLAWERFHRAGFDRETIDPRVLSLKGRLFKDRAVRAAGEERSRWYRDAAEAYHAAAATDQATYPLINAATLSLLAGDGGRSAELAGAVLARVEAHPDEPETPYYKAATIAEALLLLGRGDEARRQLTEAIRLAPEAWEDHASTLRQFALILSAQHASTAWLDALRPPRSLHFAGHMSFEPDRDREPLHDDVARLLDAERVGFGFGALAAGADIIIAEALVEAGGELHAVLPGGIDGFAARSVEPFGSEWRARFDALLERAETIRPVRPAGTAPDDATIEAADNIAMGQAIMQARRLESEALQMLVLPEERAQGEADSASDRAQMLWARDGRRQHIVYAARSATRPADRRAAASPATGSACLSILAVGSRAPSGPGFDGAEELAALHADLAGAPLAVTPFWSGQALVLAFARLDDALSTGLGLASAGWRVGGDLLVGTPFADPFTGGSRLAPATLGPLLGAVDGVLAGLFHATEDFAAALTVQAPGAARYEMVGELEGPGGGEPIALYSISQTL